MVEADGKRKVNEEERDKKNVNGGGDGGEDDRKGEILGDYEDKDLALFIDGLKF